MRKSKVRVLIIKKPGLDGPTYQEDLNPYSLSDSFSESLSSCIHLNIHRKGSSTYSNVEKCTLTDDIHFMKQHACKNFDNRPMTVNTIVQVFLKNQTGTKMEFIFKYYPNHPFRAVTVLVADAGSCSLSPS